MFTSIPVGMHAVFVKRAVNVSDSMDTVEISSLNVTFTILNVIANNHGTGFTISITTNQEATFVYQVDDEDFVPCKDFS